MRSAVLKAYADVHIDAAIVHALRNRGMDIVTAQERGRSTADDPELLADALVDERIMLTNDEDFLVHAAHYRSLQHEFAPIFYWPQQDRTVRQVVQKVIQYATQNDYASLCSDVHFL